MKLRMPKREAHFSACDLRYPAVRKVLGEHLDTRKGEQAKRDSVSVVAAALRYAREFPQRGQARAALDLSRQGLQISASGVRNIWLEHGLETTYKRLQAVMREANGMQVLTDKQRELLRRGEASRRLASKAQRAFAAEDAEEGGERRLQIMLAAAQLFVERGYVGTSIRQIAERAGLLPGSVYHHFPAKEDLFVAIQHESFGNLMRNIREAIGHSADPWVRLEWACAEHIQDVAAGDAIAQVTATGLFAIHEQGLQRRLKGDREAYDQLFRELVEALDLPKSIDRSLFRLSLLGALNWSHVWYRPGKKSPREIAAQIVSMLRFGAIGMTAGEQQANPAVCEKHRTRP